DGGDCEAVLAKFSEAGIDTDILADQLQTEGAATFVKAWDELIESAASKSLEAGKAGSVSGS
ncbi:MAG: transaldolase, partial [Pyrinomonadaceae bacterium]